MKRLLASLLSLTLLAVPAAAHDWSNVVTKLAEATAMLTDFTGDGFCSGFSIDNERDYMMTAAHCIPPMNEGFLVDNAIPVVIHFDRDLDVAVLYVEGMDRRELRPRTKLIKVGMEVGSLGFARENGLYSHFRAGNVAGIGTVDEFEGIWIQLDQAIIGGMSGGPIVDTDGKVVMINQRSDRQRTTIGRDIAAIYAATKEFWKK
jgi:S1-C subfamily serine protease